jgi:AraC family transcriptional regulator, arabinose operon regulatory protein
MTRRYATNVLVAVTCQPFLLLRPRQPAVSCGAAICSARALRFVDASAGPFLSLNLDPGTVEALTLERRVGPRGVELLDRGTLEDLEAEFRALLESPASLQQADAVVRRLLARLLHSQLPPPERDARILAIAERIRRECPADINVESIAETVGLSASRLTHLFSQQMGLPMSQFLLWTKMRRAATMMQCGQSLTEIALDSGFADAPHMNRTFAAFYGIKPSALADRRQVELLVG